MQQAREAARRSSCKNNLKQIGLALHNYHDTHSTLPMGVWHGQNGTWGNTWFVSILPQIEQGNLFNRLRFDGNHPGWTHTGVGVHNGTQADGVVFDVMACPSSPLEKLKDTGGGKRTMVPHYVGISGATSGNGFNNQGNREEDCCNCCPSVTSGGRIASGGLLVPNHPIPFAKITDGQSSTMAVSECSNFIMDGDTPTQMNSNHGFLMGTPNTARIDGSGTYSRAFNITTIRYAPNGAHKALPGVGNNDGQNNGIYSPHTGGVQSLFADGSVHFVSENIDLRTLRLLATRDDRQIAQFP